MFLSLECREHALPYEEHPSAADSQQPGYDTRRILQTGSLPVETGIRRRMALPASLCAEGSSLAAISGHGTICAILLLLGLSAIAWGYCSEAQRPCQPKSRSKLRILLMAGAAMVACSIVALWVTLAASNAWARRISCRSANSAVSQFCLSPVGREAIS